MSSRDVAGFVRAGVAAQNCVDAAVAGAQFGLARKALEAAIRAGDVGDYVMFAHMRHALKELEALREHLLEHFTRLGVDPPSTELARRDGKG